MRAKIEHKEEIGEGTLLVEFNLLGKSVHFEPGQYFYITLTNPPYADKKGNQRHFSFVNSPNQKQNITMATRISESAFKKSLKEMPVGSEVEIEGIGGNFTLPKEKSKPIVMVAGGIGITPFLSMLRYVAEEKLNYHITLLYSNRNLKTTAFLKELKELEKKISDFKLVLTMTNDDDWQGEKRSITAQFIKDYIPEYSKSLYLISGPPPMVESMKEILNDLGVKKKMIKTEKFFGY